MEATEMDTMKEGDIPTVLSHEIGNGIHLKKIGRLENDLVSRVQMNLRLKLMELLRLNKALTPEEFSERKMQLLEMVPPDLCEVPSIQIVLNEVRSVYSVNTESKSRLQKIGDFLKNIYTRK